MPARTHGERIEQLEQIVAELATETRRAFDQVAEHMKETDRRIRETDQRIRENDTRYTERSRQTDERIDRLVSAIGEFMRRN
jgi:ElaB/YqjD/DUF883 family membrane-anchored ribosome-binding protein